jgi:hypothetical protein
MAKRPARSEVNDAATAAQPKPRRGRTDKALGPESVAGLEQAGENRTLGAAPPASDEEPRSDPQPLGTASHSMSSEPTEDDIRMRAYQMYLERGGEDGGDFEDWVRAEQELRRSRGGN